MSEPEEQKLPSDVPIGGDNLIFAAEIRRLLPALNEIAATLKKIEAALAPSGYAASLFEAVRQLNISLERIRMAAFDKPLTGEEAKVLELMFPEKEGK
jgi:hypothetical protein